MLQPGAGQELHADANAEKGPGPVDNRLGQSLSHAVDGHQAVAAIGEGADTRQDDPVGFRYPVRIAGDDDLGIRADALEGLGRGAQIAGAVIDNGDMGQRRGLLLAVMVFGRGRPPGLLAEHAFGRRDCVGAPRVDGARIA